MALIDKDQPTIDNEYDRTDLRPDAEVEEEQVVLEPEPEPELAPTPRWWGDFPLDEYQVGRWQIGPTTLSIYRLPGEWRIIYNQGDDPLDPTLEIDVPAEVEAIGIDDNVRRYMFSQTQNLVTLTPVLADRPLVVRPAIPFAIETREEITLYVSLPMWLQISVAGVPQPLYEVPSFRPSDTWFGDSTLRGELCYAARTPAQLNVSELPKRPYRAIVPILIRNRDEGSLVLDRIKIPVEYLALYSSKETNQFWTQKIILEQKNRRTRLRLGWGSPQEADKTERVSPPRERARRGIDVGAFGSIFRNTRGID